MISSPKNLLLIQMLRGIASILVVLYHMTFNFSEIFGQTMLGNMFNFGGSGVDIFFVLSGFIIAYANKDFLAKPAKTATFLKRRFVRIYPIYWIIISGFLAIQLLLPAYYNSPFQLTVPNFLSTWLLLPDHININGVSWSLTNELFFYLLFTLAILIPQKKISFYLLLLYFILLIVFSITDINPTGTTGYGGLLFFPMNIEFLLGVFIVLIVDKVPVQWVWPLLISGVALFITGATIFNKEIYLLPAGTNFVLNRVVLFGIPSFLVILALVKMELNKKVRVNRIFLYLGDASYSIYLIHLPLVVAFYKVIAKMQVSNPWILGLLNVLLFCTICFTGIMIYLNIEKPLIKKLNKALSAK